MPQTPRRSSITSASLRLARPHRPFNNDPNVGRKTGRPFREVARDEDGFEPFEHVVSQGDKFTPPRVQPQPVAHRKKRRKSSMPANDEDSDDDYGMQSMDIDSPLASAAQPVSPARPRKSVSSRTLRYSDTYYDEIPSATTSGSNRSRPSLPNRSRVSDATTRTSYATTYDDDDSSDGDNNAFDMGAGYDPPDDSADEMPPPPVPRRKSFSQMNQDDDDEESEEEQPAPPPPPVKKKGKEKAAPEPEPESEPEPDHDMEQDIANGMDDVEMEGPRSDDEPEEPQQSQRSQKRKKNSDTVSAKSSRSKKENRPIVEGVRRSSRPHIKPLEYWRGEKYVYGRTESAAPVLTAPIKEIRRVAPEPVQPLGQRRKRGVSAKPRSKSAVAKGSASAVSAGPGAPGNPEEGWDDETDPFGLINDVDLGEEVKRRIVYTAKMVQTTPSANGEWAFDRIFSDANFMAAGMITLIPNGRKSTKPTKDNTYIFYVLEGAVNVRIHVQSAIVASGGMFMVPRGNTYFIENIADRETKLFFVQARKNVDPGESIVVQEGSGVSRRSSQGVISGTTDRSSGVGRRVAAS
ncbi:Mif2/CENP-C like-domain-containing protein [Schizophyllum commune]